MPKRVLAFRALVIFNMGGFLFGLSWPVVIGLYWMPLVFIVPMAFAARSFLKFANRVPAEATLDLPNAIGSVLVSWTILAAAFSLMDEFGLRVAVLSVFASSLNAGVVALALWLIGYYRVPRRSVARGIELPD